jgi:hypothetical protein
MYSFAGYKNIEPDDDDEDDEDDDEEDEGEWLHILDYIIPGFPLTRTTFRKQTSRITRSGERG